MLIQKLLTFAEVTGAERENSLRQFHFFKPPQGEKISRFKVTLIPDLGCQPTRCISFFKGPEIEQNKPRKFENGQTHA